MVGVVFGWRCALNRLIDAGHRRGHTPRQTGVLRELRRRVTDGGRRRVSAASMAVYLVAVWQLDQLVALAFADDCCQRSSSTPLPEALNLVCHLGWEAVDGLPQSAVGAWAAIKGRPCVKDWELAAQSRGPWVAGFDLLLRVGRCRRRPGEGPDNRGQRVRERGAFARRTPWRFNLTRFALLARGTIGIGRRCPVRDRRPSRASAGLS